jgi:hypothetical protein
MAIVVASPALVISISVIAPSVVAPTGVLVVVATARMDAIAMRLRRGCLHPVAAESRKREQNQSGTGSDQQRQVREHLGSAPP